MDRDTIYREDAINAICETMTELLRDNVINKKGHKKDEYFLYSESLTALKKLPPAQPKQMCVAEIKIDEEKFKKLVDNAAIRIFEQVKPKKGRWKLLKNGDAICSECGYTQKNAWDIDNWDNFCHHCGADMRGE